VKRIETEVLDFNVKKPIIIYGKDRGFALFSKGEGLWQVEQEIGTTLYRKTIHESYIEWL
jgi:hypothetical protein